MLCIFCYLHLTFSFCSYLFIFLNFLQLYTQFHFSFKDSISVRKSMLIIPLFLSFQKTHHGLYWSLFALSHFHLFYNGFQVICPTNLLGSGNTCLLHFWKPPPACKTQPSLLSRCSVRYRNGIHLDLSYHTWLTMRTTFISSLTPPSSAPVIYKTQTAAIWCLSNHTLVGEEETHYYRLLILSLYEIAILT